MRIALLFAAGAAALLAATPAHAEPVTAYQPAAQSWRHSGYSETVIEANRLRVSFRGDSGASRQSVLTLSRGYDFFVVVNHSVDADVQYETAGPPLPPMMPRRYRSETRFTATSDIMLFEGAPPLNTPAAFDARSVQANLASQIQRSH
jgi:hypothetical protein